MISVKINNITVEKKQLDLTTLINQPFLSYMPNFGLISEICEKYKNKKNLIVIANGGSLNSLLAYHQALLPKVSKNLFAINTNDPDYLNFVKSKCLIDDSLVLSISKSGENTTQIESTLYFEGYETIVLTQKGSVLEKIADAKDFKVIEHPPIGGRYTGFTEVALLPAALLSLDIEKIYQGGMNMLARFNQDNEALDLALFSLEAEKAGKVDCIVPVYSNFLAGFGTIITQLTHESFGKGGVGQSFMVYEAPEYQHHTMQRFFGGRDNMCGIFVIINKRRLYHQTLVSDDIKNVKYRMGVLGDISDIDIADALSFESRSSMYEAGRLNIPYAECVVDVLDENSVGQFMAFWQMFTVYSSVLRQVDPFNQPQVENSKALSFEYRQKYDKSY